VGAGGINACGNMIITDMVSLRERGKYIGILSLASAVGLVSGIMMGAAIAGKASWRMSVFPTLPSYLLLTSPEFFISTFHYVSPQLLGSTSLYILNQAPSLSLND
jgi:MFS family permease